jgi:hypothetical protein
MQFVDLHCNYVSSYLYPDCQIFRKSLPTRCVVNFFILQIVVVNKMTSQLNVEDILDLGYK